MHAGGQQSGTSSSLGGNSAEAAFVLPLEEVKLWFARASAGDKLLYARGRQLIHGATSRYVGELARAGLADPSQPRSKDRSGFDYIVQKRSPPTPIEGRGGCMAPPAHDDPTQRLLSILRRDANFGRRCRTNPELARLAGFATTAQLAWRFKKLVEEGVIRSDTIETGPEAGWRTVTIVSSGRSTQPPPSIQALKRSVAEVRDAGD